MEGASRTAIFAAKFRAAHAVFDSEPIFEDPFALVLADSSEADVTDLFAKFPDSSARVARLFPCQRARFVDEEVERAVGRGVDQYVVLGAELDSFAWRRTASSTKGLGRPRPQSANHRSRSWNRLRSRPSHEQPDGCAGAALSLRRSQDGSRDEPMASSRYPTSGYSSPRFEPPLGLRKSSF